MKIEKTTIKMKPINENYFLGLHEAYSLSDNEIKFSKASGFFNNIIESNNTESYDEIAQLILKNINSSDETKNLHNELISLISTLCPTLSINEMNQCIDHDNGMINYILQSMSEKKLLNPQEKTIEINEYFIIAGLILYFNELTNSSLYKLTPFSVWKQNRNGVIQLTRICRDRISSSNFPSIIMLFGSLRTGKSTLASHIMGGPKSYKDKTLFKTAGSSKACTRLINALGPIKDTELMELFQIKPESKNLNRDIFIVDSEGLNALNDETAWLKQALLAMLPVNTLTFFVAKTTNKKELDEFMKYLRLESFIGSRKIEHGLGYIDNQQTFDGSDIIEQLYDENKRSTNEMIAEFSKTSVNVDSSHFKCISVLSFDRHPNEYITSVTEVVKFIIDRCVNEGALMTGDIVADTYDEFANKIKDFGDFNDSNKMFETIFLDVLKNAMMRSIQKQVPGIKNDISQKLMLMPVQELNLLDVNSFISKVKDDGIINEVIKKAVNDTLPEIPDSFPVIIDASRTNFIDILDKIVNEERTRLLNMQAKEVHYLGRGISLIDGTSKKKVFDLKYAPNFEKINLDSNTFVVYHLPENTILEHVPIGYQKYTATNRSSLDDYVSHFHSKFNQNGSFSFASSKLDFNKACNFTQNLTGLAFSSNSPQMNISVSTNVDSLAQVHFNQDVDLKQHLSHNLKMKFDELNKVLINHDIKSKEVQNIVSDIYSDYGELVATGFFIGKYVITISHNEKLDIKSGGHAAFSSTSNESNGLNLGGVSIGNSQSKDKNEENSYLSQVISSSQTKTTISYGSSTKPATFMFDIIDNSSFGSSFVPLFKFASSKNVSDALEYWIERWNAKPISLIEYMKFIDTNTIPYNQNITLYHNNRPYTVYVNNKGELVLPDCQIIYTTIDHYAVDGEGVKRNSITQQKYDVILDPSTMTINNLPENPYAKKWKVRVSHHQRGYGHYNFHVQIILSPFWEFNQPITKAFFSGYGTNYMNLTYINSHSFKIEFFELPDGTGKSWNFGPYYITQQQSIKVKLI